MSENGIFLYFWTKKVIFKPPPPPRLHMTKTNYKRKNGIFLYFEMEEKKLGLHMIKLFIRSKIKQKCVAETPKKMPYPG